MALSPGTGAGYRCIGHRFVFIRSEHSHDISCPFERMVDGGISRVFFIERMAESALHVHAFLIGAVRRAPPHNAQTSYICGFK